jgi:GT2 family glycosyltransferase
MQNKNQLAGIVIRVLVSCHNRAGLTHNLMALLPQNSNFEIEVFAVDDGSTDATAQVLAQCRIIKSVFTGDGSLFWARSMEIAESLALDTPMDLSKEYFLLWLNDDVELFTDAFPEAVKAAVLKPQAIFVGAMRESNGGHSYGGFVRSGLHPLGFKKVEPNGHLQRIETFNGNFVLYSIETARRVGPIDRRFSHSLADIDYGLRASRAGVPIFQLPEPVGICNLNPVKEFETRIGAWRDFTSIKGGGHFASLRIILRKRTRLWLFYIVATYSLWWFRRVDSRNRYLA